MTDLIQPPDPKEQPAQPPPVPKVSTPPCSVDRYLYSLFLQLGIPANKRGFHHLCVAVKLALENPELQHHLMHGLYPKVAEQLGTNVCCVERSIRTAITSAWSRGRPDLIEKQLGLRKADQWRADFAGNRKRKASHSGRKAVTPSGREWHMCCSLLLSHM